MDKPIQIVVVGSDPALRAEFEAAAEGVPNRRILAHYVREINHAEDAARSRRPQLICVDMPENARAVMTFAREMVTAQPGAAVIAMYRPDRAGAGEDESAFIIDSLRSGVRDFLRRPVSSTELRVLIDRLTATREVTRTRLGTVMSFISNKGGVGKSTISVNTACLLARRRPDEVLLIDASLQLGICALMLDLLPATTLIDAVREKERLDETLLRRLAVPHPSGLRVLAAPTDAAEAAEVDDESMARILNLARRSFRYTIVDTFPMLDSTVMTILDLSDLAYIVMQGTAPSVVGMAKLLPVLTTLGFPAERQRIVLNQNYRRFVGDLTIADIEGRLHRPINYFIPYQKKILVSMNTGVPYALRARRLFGCGLALAEIADDMENIAPQGDETTAPVSRAATATTA
jgi:pilus assembly protein CpaE